MEEKQEGHGKVLVERVQKEEAKSWSFWSSVALELSRKLQNRGRERRKFLSQQSLIPGSLCTTDCRSDMAEETSGAGDSAEQEVMLERLLTRLALTEDSKLEPVLAKLLPYAISCLGTPRQSTKQKVMDMLTHINKRVKGHPSIKLPLQELLKLYRTEAAASMVKSFSLVYMEMAFDRRSKEEAEIAPGLLVGLSQLPAQHQDILLRMAAKEMEKYASERMDESSVVKYTFVKTAADCDIFIDFCLQTMVYQFNSSLSEGFAVPPAGLSRLQAIRISGKSPLKGDQLMTRKMGLLNVVAELNLVPELIYPVFITASVDSNDRVAKRAEELLKRKAGGVNLEDPMLIKRLFSIFQGTVGNEGMAADARVSPASPALKGKLMGVFTRSIAAANSFPATLHCIFDCIYGNESYPRLKQAGMEFTVWIFKHASSEQLKPMAPIILSGILKLLDKQVPSEADSSSKQLRVFAYQAIGQLGQRAPYLFGGSTEIVVRLFEALRTESPSIRFTVQEAITSLAFAYKDCSGLVARQVDTLLLNNAQAVEQEARFCTIWWANKVYEFKHCASRFICMLGASDDRLDIREMALEGLLPPKQDGGGQGDYPSVADMLDYICQQQPMLLLPAEVGERELLFPSKTYISMITFILTCYEAEMQIGNLLPEEQFLLLLEHAMASNGSVELHAKASSGMLTFASKVPQKFGDRYCNRIPWLKQYLGHIDSTTRETIARLLGIVTATLATPKVVNLLEDLKSTFTETQKGRFEDIHGAVCAAGYVLAQCMTGMPTVPRQFLGIITAALLKVGRSGNPVLSGSVAEAIGHVGLRGPLPLLQGDKSFLSLSLGPHKSGQSEETGTEEHTRSVVDLEANDAVVGEAAADGASSASVTELLKEIVSSKEIKSVQKAVIAYGHLCYGNPTRDLLDEALNALFGLSKSKVEDVLFSVGEALSFIWGGLSITADEILKSSFISLSRDSNFLSDNVPAHGNDMEMLPVTGSSNDELAAAREVIVHKLFDNLLFSGRKEERCAGAVWLLSIITYCGRHPRVQQMLPEIQEAFSHLLGEQNDLTQEMASRGMSIVYELGDASTKDELVKALVNALSGTARKKRAVKLMEDSEVFEEGAIGEKPGGGNISTYKELCSLANEMGQPDLIYKFMDLANYQTSLNSKRGAAFGFAKIAKQAGDALRPYLRSLVPKLVRYQYDPNKQIQDAMGHIWRSVVAEPKKTVDEYFDDIMEDLLSQAGSRLWRSRESSCLALADILQGRRFHEVEKYLERIWTMAFRAVDDIKETVRTAGDSLSRAVSSLTLRLSDTSLTAEADAMATVMAVIPFLLSKGIMSTVSDVRKLSINTVMKLAKNAGSSIRPQLPDLIICMLESLSSLEDQRLNYAELHAERAGISTEKLESLRIAVAKDSPMWETLDFCLRQVDLQTLDLLVPRLIQLVRSGVGLNTRVGVAKFISLLTQQIGSDIRQHAGAFLKVLKLTVQNEKSSSSRRAFASTCAAVAKYAGEAQIQRLFEDSVALYQSGALDARVASALLLNELSHQASDTFKGYHALVLPVVFVARFDEEKDVSNIFEDIWEENTSSENVALQLYTSDIIPLVLEGLSSTSWTQKQKSAKAVGKIAEVAGDSLAPFVQQLLKAVLDELPGRLWEGKEVLLDAVGAICKSCHTVISKEMTSDGVNQGLIVAAVSTACRRRKSSFHNAAFSCLEQVLMAFKDQDLFEEVFPFLMECCNGNLSSKSIASATDQSGQGENDLEDKSTVSLEKVLPCLRSSIMTAPPLFVLSKAENIVECLVGILSGGHSWQVKLSALSATQAFVGQLQMAGSQEGNDCYQTHFTKSLESLCLPVLECVSSTKVGQVRIAGLECLVAMLQNTHFRADLSMDVGGTFTHRMLQLHELEKNALAKSLMQSIITSVNNSSDNSMQE